MRALALDHRSSRRSLCGKWPVLNDLLNQWRANGDKVLIFSRSVRMLRAIRQWFEEDHPDFKYLDGGVPQHKRLGLCDEFNTDPSVFSFLISTMAGGVGLNLTAANKVVILDPNCPFAFIDLTDRPGNPSHDLQAMDRAYRWGQTRDVDVYRMIAAGSIEELIYIRQIYKQQQANVGYTATAERRFFGGVQGSKSEHGELFGVENIFRLGDDKNFTKQSVCCLCGRTDPAASSRSATSTSSASRSRTWTSPRMTSRARARPARARRVTTNRRAGWTTTPRPRRNGR